MNDVMDRCHVEIWIIRYNKALAASVRVPEDALLHEGLLLRVVRQLVLNSEHTGSARQNVRTWCGALLQRIHVVWPQFRIQLLGRLSWTGGPFLGPPTSGGPFLGGRGKKSSRHTPRKLKPTETTTRPQKKNASHSAAISSVNGYLSTPQS